MESSQVVFDMEWHGEEKHSKQQQEIPESFPAWSQGAIH